ncbi:SDR family oxidoreductase [Salinivibrio kushneri]|uniref:SDR family oxidoreductase n=1 Tax=Salinivibrio kushneri TaxID=1908198 RepID=UPI0022B34F2B|nr:SDR family oxidoreductase [Salinivibrio kushneri]WBA13309.1 SDR family oxidoreductase [Salinivibrio kushneri]
MNPVAIVTGASGGIGRETAKLLAQRGYAICINYLSNSESAFALVDELQAIGVNAIAVQADVSSEEGVKRLFSEADNRLGNITALVNNAGIMLPQSAVSSMGAERINAMFQANVTSAFLCCREAVHRMAQSRGGNGGAIVNVSSAAVKTGSPNEYVDYAATKAALDTLTMGLAKEVGREGIRVNAVRPGPIDTDMHAAGGEPDRVARVADNIPLGRGGSTLEVAEMIAWLLSDNASYSTGSLFDVAGGM